MRYEVELYDHRDQQKVIVYADGGNELEAALSVMDRAPDYGQIKNIKQMREFYCNSNIQFIGIKEDIYGGPSYEVPKSAPRSDNRKEKKTRRNASHQSHR